MSSLKEFLKKQAQEQSASADEREAARDEWVEAVDRLVTRLTDWLREADSDTVLKIEPTVHRIREPRLGSYEAKGLLITLGAREIGLVPVARYSIGSIVGDAHGETIRHGRLDLTNIEKKYMLYRGKREQEDFWVIVDDRDYAAKPLDQTSFEAAIQSMLE
ncbi:hypothetical protein [Singulisphaera sp. GP187]|uniref:hypothetical protein n=1 Tax=Singulisphaera sp. GP187 TaxID=1882752 RepID=UPI00094104C8|nr:hypothetical protein [Singulisphaera sp. GP187]